MVIDLLLVSIMVVFIVDLSGFMDHLKKRLWLWLKGDVPYKDYRLKPFDCSLCMTFWIGILTLILTSSITLINLVIVCMLSWFSDVIGSVMRQIKDVLITLINKVFPL